MNIDLKKYKSDLLFTALGGASEIGMNVNLYHLDGKWLMVDLGLGFAHDVPGIDMLAPDISFIKSQKKNLLGLVITHIHEDHLGAVQYLWEELEMPIYTSNFTAQFLRSKLEEYKFASRVKIFTVDPSKELNLEPFKIEFIGLTHSVPEMHALMIKTNHGNILHSGDWKFDPDPVVGNISEKEKIKSYGDKGDILALVCDSTNALSPGRSKSEGDLFASLKKIISNCNQMVGVTTFASNIARIHTISQVAQACGRKIVLTGFSLKRLFEVGKKSGYFQEATNFISDREIKFFDRSEILILSTGCQGEPLAGTMKIAHDAHPTIKFVAGDTMIFSSKIIPGNEKSIFALFNAFARKKVEVITEKDHFVHVSGHPNQDELREMYELAKPKIAIPVHGEFVHMKQHAAMAREWGVSNVIEIENGSVVKLSSADGAKGASIIGSVPTGYFGVDNKQLLPLDGEIIKTRQKLQFAGIVIVVVTIDADTGGIIGDIHVSAPGSYDFKNDREALDMLKQDIAKTVRGMSKSFVTESSFKFFTKKKRSRKNSDDNKVASTIEKSIRSITQRNFNHLTGKKPLLEIVVRIC